MIHSNIIGISGHLNGGKDYSAKIIQYHLGKKLDNLDNIDLEEFCSWDSKRRFKSSTFENKAFAAKLKNMVAELLGITVEKLEDREFKEKTISELGVSPRYLLQTLGTEWGRDLVDQDIWAKALLRNHIASLHMPTLFPETIPPVEVKPNWLITDVRFINEVEAIKKAGGIVIRVNRPVEFRNPDTHEDFLISKFDEWDEYLKSIDLFDKIYHPSETSLDNYQGFDHIVEWKEDATDLVIGLEYILRYEQII